MGMIEILDGLSVLSARTLSLAVRNPSKLRSYVSYCLKKYDELAGNGLPWLSPVTPTEDLTITIPAAHTGGGMSFGELVILARVTKTLRPRSIFEIGTYNGLTSAVFILNSDSDTRIVTLDLPLEPAENQPCISGDRELTASRQLGSVPQALGLHRYTQLLCDSLAFDPSPYLNSVDLALVDGAHDLLHLKNDTFKVVRMMSDDGLIFWHDYGRRGPLRPLASYLEDLGKRSSIYRIRDTSLAWARARELKSAMDGFETRAGASRRWVTATAAGPCRQAQGTRGD